MASQTDFLALYQRLGVRADCSEAEFKNAYRRLIAELHPDRRAGQGDLLDAGHLSELTSGYTAAMAFRRRHGRLPGALRPTPPPMRADVVAAALRASAAGAGGAAQAPRRVTSPPVLRPRHILAGLAVVAAAGAALWVADAYFDDDNAPRDIPEPAHVEYRDAAPAVTSQIGDTRAEAHLELGLDADAVLAIQGRPLAQNSRRWDYGPSWIAFDNGRVSDWYSSSLHPLKTPVARPLERLH